MSPRDKIRRAKRKAAEHLSNIGSLADKQAVNLLRKECKLRREAGEDVRVGHIVPLRHTKVCGLTNIANLRIMTSKEDDTLGNSFTPGRTLWKLLIN